MLFQKNLINLALNGSKTESILAEIPLIADDNFNEVNDVNRPDKKMNYCVMDTLFWTTALCEAILKDIRL